jgi:flagellar hook-associated protein 2
MSSSSSVGSASGAPITFGGLASGIDTNSIIQKLIQLDQIPITNLQTQITNIQTKQSALNQLGTNLQALQAAAQTISSDVTTNSASGTSSNTGVATITTGVGATPGIYSLSVSQLAQAQKVASAAQAGVAATLNQSGTFIVNGKSVSVVASDTLTTIAQKINSVGAGVTASIIDGGTGNGYLTIASNNTGSANAIHLSDFSGTVLQQLGVIGGKKLVANPITNGAKSESLSSQTSSIGTLLNLTTPPSGTFSVNGVSVSVNPATDSLQTIANSINSANTGATATVVSSTSNGTTSYQLQITGSGSTPTFSDPNGILSSIGVLQGEYGNPLVAAQDANYSLDGVNLTSSTNTVTTAIPGATITLLQGSTTPSGGGSPVPSTTTLSLSANTSGLTTDINSFVSAYNAVVDYVGQNSQLDTSTFQTGPLFGDFAADQAMSSITGFLFNNVPGISGTYNNIASLGFSLDQSGHLSVNQTQLSAALSTNYAQVGALFGATGAGSNTNISFVGSTSKTVSNGNPYALNITQLATKGSYTGETAQTSPNPNAETLTFKGALLGGNNYTLNLDVNSSLTDTINKINNDATLKGLVVASNNNGKLEIDSRQYGKNGNFTVVSNETAASNNSGIGVGSLGTTVTGVDIAGTINGEAATGNGQFLTGNSGNKTTDGLTVEYNGTSTGSVGSITFSKGVASQMNDIVSQLTDATNGILTSDNNAFTQQITDLNNQISSLQTQMQAHQAELQTEFSAMETAISQLQSQSTALASLGVNTSSSSSSSGSSSSSNSSKVG